MLTEYDDMGRYLPMVWADARVYRKPKLEKELLNYYFSCFVTDISMSKAVTTQISNETVSDR